MGLGLGELNSMAVEVEGRQQRRGAPHFESLSRVVGSRVRAMVRGMARAMVRAVVRALAEVP